MKPHCLKRAQSQLLIIDTDPSLYGFSIYFVASPNSRESIYDFLLFLSEKKIFQIKIYINSIINQHQKAYHVNTKTLNSSQYVLDTENPNAWVSFFFVGIWAAMYALLLLCCVQQQLSLNVSLGGEDGKGCRGGRATCLDSKERAFPAHWSKCTGNMHHLWGTIFSVMVYLIL